VCELSIVGYENYNQPNLCALSLQVLAAELPGVVSSLSFKKSMRWDGFGVAYSRPMRWLMALHGATPITFSYGGLVASPSTRVLRNAPQPLLQVGPRGPGIT